MKKLKKITAVAMAIAMTCAITACDDKKSSDTYTIGICQLVQHEALDDATKGFKDALKEKLGDKVEFDEQNASGEKTNCTTIISQFVSSNVDLIMANATDALTAAVSATENIPIVGTSITDYATALQIEDWKGTTGMNVTGTADLAPLKEQAAMIKELCPDKKTVGILYCSNEANSKYQADIIKSELEGLGYTCKIYTFVDTNDVTAITQTAVDSSDVLYIPTDNTAASNTEAINNITEPAKIPVFTGEEGICKGCGVATLSISYYDIGFRAGEMAYEILENGAKPEEMKIDYSTDLTKKYVAKRAETLNLKIPESYKPITMD